MKKLKQSFKEVQDLLDKMETQNITFNKDDFDIVSESTGNYITLGYNKNFYSDNVTQDMDGRFVIFEYFKCGSTEPKISYSTSMGDITITTVAKRFYSAEGVIQSNFSTFISGTSKYVRYIFITNKSLLTNADSTTIANNFAITVDNVLYQLNSSNVGSIQHVSLKKNTTPITNTYHFLSTFEKIVFIGDSLTAGYTSYKTPTIIGSNLARAANRNWPYYLALRNGREDTWVNKGYGSTTSHDWRYKNTTLFDAANGDEMSVVMGLTDTQIYNLAIGYNDRSKITLGTVNDIDTSTPDNNPDTYCGNLGWMVSKLLTVNSTCRIVISTMPNIKDRVSIDETWNAAIRNVVNKFKDTGRVFLLDLGSADYADYYNADILSKTWNGHLFPLAYEYVSWITEKAYEDVLMKNYESFAYLPLLS